MTIRLYWAILKIDSIKIKILISTPKHKFTNTPKNTKPMLSILKVFHMKKMRKNYC